MRETILIICLMSAAFLAGMNKERTGCAGIEVVVFDCQRNQ